MADAARGTGADAGTAAPRRPAPEPAPRTDLPATAGVLPLLGVDGSWLAGGQPPVRRGASVATTYIRSAKVEEGVGRAYESDSVVFDSRIGVSLLTSDFAHPLCPRRIVPTFRSQLRARRAARLGTRSRRPLHHRPARKDAFTVIDDGKPQTLEMFSADEVPGDGWLPDRQQQQHAAEPRARRRLGRRVCEALASAGRDLRPDIQRSRVRKCGGPTAAWPRSTRRQFASAMDRRSWLAA